MLAPITGESFQLAAPSSTPRSQPLAAMTAAQSSFGGTKLQAFSPVRRSAPGAPAVGSQAPKNQLSMTMDQGVQTTGGPQRREARAAPMSTTAHLGHAISRQMTMKGTARGDSVMMSATTGQAGSSDVEVDVMPPKTLD